MPAIPSENSSISLIDESRSEVVSSSSQIKEGNWTLPNQYENDFGLWTKPPLKETVDFVIKNGWT